MRHSCVVSSNSDCLDFYIWWKNNAVFQFRTIYHISNFISFLSLANFGQFISINLNKNESTFLRSYEQRMKLEMNPKNYSWNPGRIWCWPNSSLCGNYHKTKKLVKCELKDRQKDRRYEILLSFRNENDPFRMLWRKTYIIQKYTKFLKVAECSRKTTTKTDLIMNFRKSSIPETLVSTL